MALNIGAFLYLYLYRIWGCQKIRWFPGSSLEQWVHIFSFASFFINKKYECFSLLLHYPIIHLNYFSSHSTENNQYSTSNFYSAPAGQSVYSYSAPVSQPSRESSESKPVYLSGGRAPLATHQTGNIVYLINHINSMLHYLKSKLVNSREE